VSWFGSLNARARAPDPRFFGPQLSICGTNSCADFPGSGSPLIALNTVSVVMDAPIPTPIATIMSTVRTTLRLRLRIASTK
jgi:hypothetical protein